MHGRDRERPRYIAAGPAEGEHQNVLSAVNHRLPRRGMSSVNRFFIGP